jgi:hypothetical protein
VQRQLQLIIDHQNNALIQRILTDCRNYALENAMEAANLPLVELMDRSAQHMPMSSACAMQLCNKKACLIPVRNK